MKNKVIFYGLIVCCLLYAFSLKANAQEATVRFNDVGISLEFKAEKVSPTSKKSYVLDDNFYSQMYVEKDQNKTLHRVISDRESGLYFGYDLQVGVDAKTGKFSLSVRPLSIKPVMEKQLRDLAVGSLSAYPEALTVEDGDIITLDILEEPRTKVKIVDVVKVKIVNLDKTNSLKNSLEPSPNAVLQPKQDFTPEVFQMIKLTNFKIFLNGTEVANPGGVYGQIVYFYLPEKGRFIFSLAPHEGYDFQKIGTVEGNEISFTADGDSYKVVSTSPILAVGGSWNIWVLHDRDFRPEARFSAYSPYWAGAGQRVEDFIKKKQ